MLLISHRPLYYPTPTSILLPVTTTEYSTSRTSPGQSTALLDSIDPSGTIGVHDHLDNSELRAPLPSFSSYLPSQTNREVATSDHDAEVFPSRSTKTDIAQGHQPMSS